MSASAVSMDPEKVEVVMSWGGGGGGGGRSQSSRYAVSWDWLGITGDSLRISPDWQHL